MCVCFGEVGGLYPGLCLLGYVRGGEGEGGELVTGEFALLSLHYHILLQILGFRFSIKVREDRHPVHTSI